MSSISAVGETRPLQDVALNDRFRRDGTFAPNAVIG
jgi:hypothetical protein